MQDLANWWPEFWQQWQTPIRILAILLGAVIARWILLASVKRVLNQVENGTNGKLNNHDAKQASQSPIAKARVIQRSRTLASVLSNLITWSLLLFAVGAVLSELGVAVGALVASAGILGAALGFGAQSLVKDLINGLFIIFEDQFGVGDSVDLGEARGVIENVGLRVTQVRDVNGVLWYVRNGEIIRVGNHSQGWSRVILDIPLSYKVNIEKARQVILEAAKELVKDSNFAKRMLGQPEIWGIESITADQVVMRLVQQVGPQDADDVARELRLRVKTKLDAAKITLASDKNAIFVDVPEKAKK
jgi:small conductance mechanosensitive channel